jgi:hypothetical protein
MSCSAFSLFLFLTLTKRKHRKWQTGLILMHSRGQNGICLTKYAPESIQFHWFRIKTKFLIIAEINKLVFCQIGRGSVVSIAPGYGPNDWGVGVRVPVGLRIFSKSSRSTLGSTQHPIQWVPGALSPGVKRQGREADQTSSKCQGQENVDLYIHSPIRLHGVVLNSLSTGTTLPLPLPDRHHWFGQEIW